VVQIKLVPMGIAQVKVLPADLTQTAEATVLPEMLFAKTAAFIKIM
jgi:hypothetical protein